MAISYEWTPEEQREYALAKLFKYIKDYVYPNHPYYRKLFKDNKINPDKLNSYDDLRRIPITTKEDTLADQKAFILQPKLPDTTYDVEKLGKGQELKYVWQTLNTRYLRDIYGKPRPFMDRVKQTAAAEWNPIHFHVSGGTTGCRAWRPIPPTTLTELFPI